MASGSGLTRGTVSLTHRSIEALRPAEAPYRVSDQRCIGLAVRVAPSGVKTWDLVYRIRGSGKVRRVSLGRVADVSLERARERANELTSAARAGRDLIAEEKRAELPLPRGSRSKSWLSSTCDAGLRAACGPQRKSRAACGGRLLRSCIATPTIFAGATFGNC